MGRDPLAAINPRTGTSQREKAREDQVKNNAGGYVFQLDDMKRLDRFLMIGTDGGTYYVKEQEHTKQNAQFILDLAASDHGVDMVRRIVEISLQGRAHRQNSILFALAAATAYGSDITRYDAYNAVPKVVRTGSHLFQFITYREQLAGWGRGMRWAVGQAWYNMKDVDKLAYQMVKYRTRNDWSHKDVLRLSHPKPVDKEHEDLYRWSVGKEGTEDLPALIDYFQALQKADSVKEVVAIIRDYDQISWEMIPDKFINEPAVWRALIHSGVPQTALIRQLPRLTRIGLLEPFDRAMLERVSDQLVNPVMLKRGRIHPIQLLIAQKTYASGRGTSSNWIPIPHITDALDKAFYAAFSAVEPTGKRILLAVDVSGSMNSPLPSRNPREPMPLTVRDAAAALTLVTAATEPNAAIFAFSDGTQGTTYSWGDESVISPLNISPCMRLDDVTKYMQSLRFGRTDLSLPMVHALQKGINVDAFVIYTDNETWYGNIHPQEALRKYRQKINPNAKLVVVAMTSTGFSIADPLDMQSMDVAGFDASVPTLIADFLRD